MKKLISLIFCLFIVAAMCVPTFAGSFDDAIKEISGAQRFRYYSPDEIWGAEISQRGFCASQDGKYLFGGFLSGTRQVVKFDAKTGEPLGNFTTGEENPKSVATDDRGYLYIGLSNVEEANYYTVIAVNIETMQEVSRVKITLSGSGKAGMNGMQVINVDGKYVLHASINYDFSLIAAVNVTDPAAMAVDTSFGNNGYLSLGAVADACKADTGWEVSDSEVHCFAIDGDGNFYFAMTLGLGASKGDALVKAAYDGTYIGAVECTDAYGAAYYNGYAFISVYEDGYGNVMVFDAETLEKVSEIVLEDNDHGELIGVAVFSDAIYIGDQRFGGESGFYVVRGLSLPTPETGSGNQETGDIAIALSAIALVAVFAAMIISKRRVTE